MTSTNPLVNDLDVAFLLGLTHGAAHLIEAYGTEALKDRAYMKPMYAGASGTAPWPSRSRTPAAAWVPT
jgi:hypothetical protein